MISPLWWREVGKYVARQGSEWSLVFGAGLENEALSDLSLAHLSAR